MINLMTITTMMTTEEEEGRSRRSSSSRNKCRSRFRRRRRRRSNNRRRTRRSRGRRRNAVLTCPCWVCGGSPSLAAADRTSIPPALSTPSQTLGRSVLPGTASTPDVWFASTGGRWRHQGLCHLQPKRKRLLSYVRAGTNENISQLG